MHRRSLERFPFDSVLCPYNYVQMQDARYAETFDALAAVCAERNVALQTIKSLASRPLGRARERPRPPGTSRCASRPTSTSPPTGCSATRRSFLLTTGDVEILPRLLDAAERFESRPPDEQMAELVRERELAPLFV